MKKPKTLRGKKKSPVDENSFGGRILRRAKALGKSIKSIERDIGVADCHISDVTEGRKSSVRAGVVKELAILLETTDVWLVRGVGPEVVKALPTPLLPSNDDNAPVALRVGSSPQFESSREERVVFACLDMATGACAIMLNGQRYRGAVVDPVFRFPGNIYAESMASMSPVRVLVKDAITDAGERVSFILDAPQK